MYNLTYLWQFDGKSSRGKVFYAYGGGKDAAEDYDRVWQAFRRKTFLREDEWELVVGINGLEDMPCFYRALHVTPMDAENVRFVFLRDIDWATLMPQLDCYILSRSGSEELALLDLACVSGVRVVPFDRLDGFGFIPDSPEAMVARAQLDEMLQRQFFGKFPPQTHEYMLFSQGLQETSIFFFLMRQYRERHRRKVIVLCLDPTREAVLRHCPYIDAAVTIPPRLYMYIALFCAKRRGIRNIYDLQLSGKFVRCAHLRPPHSAEPPWPDLYGLPEFLGLPGQRRLDKYPFQLPAECVQTARAKFDGLGLRQGRAVFLIADSISNGVRMPADFWLRLVAALRRQGYDVVLKSDRELLPGVPSAMFLPLESVAFAELCGTVISITTGLMYFIGAFSRQPSLKVKHLMRLDWLENRDLFFVWLRYLSSTVREIGNAGGEDHVAAGTRLMRQLWEMCTDLPCQDVLCDEDTDPDELIAQLTADM